MGAEGGRNGQKVAKTSGFRAKNCRISAKNSEIVFAFYSTNYFYKSTTYAARGPF
jgi:hypothetical protein